MDRTETYPEVGGEESGLVPPQGHKGEWPKKIRTLTAVELDRLTIDGDGRFYWDGRLVNYEAQRQEARPADLDALAILDRAAVEAREGPVGRAADLVRALEADEHQLAPLGTEVDPGDVVEDDREVAGRMALRKAEVGGVVAPGLDRDLDAGGRGEPGRPRARRDHHRVGVDRREADGVMQRRGVRPLGDRAR